MDWDLGTFISSEMSEEGPKTIDMNIQINVEVFHPMVTNLQTASDIREKITVWWFGLRSCFAIWSNASGCFSGTSQTRDVQKLNLSMFQY